MTYKLYLNTFILYFLQKFIVLANKDHKKLQQVDLGLSDKFKSNGSDIWRVNTIKKEVPILDLADKYIY